MNGSWWQERSLKIFLYCGRQAGGFVNCDVTALFTKLPAEPFLALPGTIPENAVNSAIHKAASLMVTRLCLVLFHHSIIPLKNVPLGVYGSRRQEWPPETVLYGGRQSGGFVNRAVNCQCWTVSEGRSNRRQNPGRWLGAEDLGKSSGCWFVYQWRYFTCQHANDKCRDVIFITPWKFWRHLIGKTSRVLNILYLVTLLDL